MANQVKRCELVRDYVGADGTIHCHSDCGQCSMLQMAYSLTGPWYDDRIVTVGQDIILTPNPTPGGSAQFWRLVPCECPQEKAKTPFLA